MKSANQKQIRKMGRKIISPLTAWFIFLLQIVSAPGVSLAGQIFTRPSGSNEPWRPVQTTDSSAQATPAVQAPSQPNLPSTPLPVNEQPVQTASTESISAGGPIEKKSKKTPPEERGNEQVTPSGSAVIPKPKTDVRSSMREFASAVAAFPREERYAGFKNTNGAEWYINLPFGEGISISSQPYHAYYVLELVNGEFRLYESGPGTGQYFHLDKNPEEFAKALGRMLELFDLMIDDAKKSNYAKTADLSRYRDIVNNLLKALPAPTGTAVPQISMTLDNNIPYGKAEGPLGIKAYNILSTTDFKTWTPVVTGLRTVLGKTSWKTSAAGSSLFFKAVPVQKDWDLATRTYDDKGGLVSTVFYDVLDRVTKEVTDKGTTLYLYGDGVAEVRLNPEGKIEYASRTYAGHPDWAIQYFDLDSIMVTTEEPKNLRLGEAVIARDGGKNYVGRVRTVDTNLGHYENSYGVDQEGIEYEQFEISSFGRLWGVTRAYYGRDGERKDYQYIKDVYEYVKGDETFSEILEWLQLDTRKEMGILGLHSVRISGVTPLIKGNAVVGYTITASITLAGSYQPYAEAVYTYDAEKRLVSWTYQPKNGAPKTILGNGQIPA